MRDARKTVILIGAGVLSKRSERKARRTAKDLKIRCTCPQALQVRVGRECMECLHAEQSTEVEATRPDTGVMPAWRR
jgi:hypothetical protein